MAAERHSLLPVVGPDGLAMDAPVIAYTEKIIEEEQLQLKRYIKENYSKIRDVEIELENLTLEMKLTAGPKKAALEHLRKKIELSTERMHAAKIKEAQARKVWEAAAMAVKDEEAVKQKLCDDLNQLVQESAASQFSRLEELKKRLEALNPIRASSEVPEGKSVPCTQSGSVVSNPVTNNIAHPTHRTPEEPPNCFTASSVAASKNDSRPSQADIEGKVRKKASNLGRGKGNILVSKGRGSPSSGWTGAGFDVDGGV
uniref:Actin cytoskeleton-regulatory complex protein PAN1 n=1 Tax=Anthurium amnicola TaxID=1678845 RepID=A0A1D1Z972_9ARAE